MPGILIGALLMVINHIIAVRQQLRAQRGTLQPEGPCRVGLQVVVRAAHSHRPGRLGRLAALRAWSRPGR